MTTFAFPAPDAFPVLFAREASAPARPWPAARADAPATEAEWVRAARGGDPDAFRRLVDRHRTAVVELCLRVVRSREEAEEAAQDAFVRAWKALPEFRGEAKFSTWLYRIAVRRALDAAIAQRKRRQRENATEPASLDERGAESGPGGLEDAARRRLWRILGDLEPLPRAAVSLFYLGDRSVGEVAEILTLPEGTVKTHLHRSRAALRRAWTLETTREERLGLPRL